MLCGGDFVSFADSRRREKEKEPFHLSYVIRLDKMFELEICTAHRISWHDADPCSNARSVAVRDMPGASEYE